MRRREQPDGPAGSAILFGRGYWVSRERRLLGGAYPGDPDSEVARRKLAHLEGLGIRHIVNLMEPDETDHGGRPFTPYEPEWQRRGHTVARFPIRDQTAPSPRLMATILEHIDQRLDAQAGVLVHCWGGRGRTGTVVGCWLIRHGLAAPADACAVIRRLRALCSDAHLLSPETGSQRRLVEGWRPVGGGEHDVVSP